MKNIALLLIISLLSITVLQAQKVVPLGGYEFLNKKQKGQPEGLVKMNCDNLLPEDFVAVTAEDSIDITITVDTNGFETGSGYACLNCDDLEYGTLATTSEGFTYTANSDVEQGLDTLELAFCNPAGDNCSAVVTVVVVAQRAPRIFNFPAETLSPQEQINIDVPADELPGGSACRAFVDCEDDYLGNEQLVYFLSDIMLNNNFSYVAARYAGVDQVCFKLCNEYGLCDEYNYEFVIVRPNVNLPFFDDFSNDGNRPRTDLWQNEDVLVNRNYAVAPPSIGVATFDGVGPRGFAYPLAGSGVQTRDFLTSASINMGGASNQVITFYVQLRGLGDRPEINDSLRLEFLKPDGNWTNVWSTRGISPGFGNCLDTAFTAYQVPIGNQFYYDGFQFRFSNLSGETGALDNWNLDYVRIDVQSSNNFNFNDIALVEIPPSILENYTNMPYRQLVAGGEGLLRSTFLGGIENHFNDDKSISQSGYTIVNSGNELLEENFDPLNAVLGNTVAAFDDTPNAQNYQNFVDDLFDFSDDGAPININLNYNLNDDEFTEDTRATVVNSVLSNNTATITTTFADYYAYDDGSAELGLEALPGQTVVQRYEAFTDEVLRGVSIRLPRSNANVSNLSIDLVVFLGELEDGAAPDLSMTVNPIYVESFYSDSLGGYTSYAFPDSLDIPAGAFYVGWRQNGNCNDCVPVGLDRNTNISGTRFFRNSGDWFPLEGCSFGSLMIRPLVGDTQVPITSTDDVASASTTSIYPNPANDRVFIATQEQLELSQINWTLFSLTGNQIAKGIGNRTGIDLSTFTAGTYFLQLVNNTNGTTSYHKLIVQ